jgi:hypothetical protein
VELVPFPFENEENDPILGNVLSYKVDKRKKNNGNDTALVVEIWISNHAFGKGTLGKHD